METSTQRRRSKVWLAFIPEGSDDYKAALCRICNSTLPLISKEGENRSTAKLWKHLSTEHAEVSKILSGLSQDVLVDGGIMEQWNLSILQKHAPKGFTSKVWKYFGLDESDRNISICYECGDRVSRGCDRNTTSMWNHMKQKHPANYSAAHQEEERDAEDNSPLAEEKAAVKEQFLLYSARQNSYICKTCGTIMRLESPDEEINTSRLQKHLDNIFHKRVQHGLEPPKRPILPKYFANTAKAEGKKKPEKPIEPKKTLPLPISAEKVALDRESDLIHSAIVMQTLYLQQKKDLCCDCTIVVPHQSEKPSNFDRATIPGPEENSIECYESRAGFEFKFHSSILAVVSDKMRSMFENSETNTIMMHDVSRESMKYFIEIAYLGKSRNVHSLPDAEVCDVYNTALSFGASLVAKYIEKEFARIHDKLISEAINNPSSGKVSFLVKYKTDDIVKSTANKPPPVTDSMSNRETPNFTSMPVKSSSSRRKRPPLSTTFRLKVPKLEDGESSDSEIDSSLNLNGQALENGDDTLERGMKFEIQGDTAILRASPTDMDEHDDINFNSEL